MAQDSGIQIEYERPAIINQYTKQKEFIDCPTPHAIIEATSKAGKTVGCIVWIYEQALADIPGRDTKEGTHYWWVAPVASVAKIAYRRMKRFIQPRELYTHNDTELSINLINGATITFKSADHPDSLYGEDVYGAVLDEASRMKEDAYIAIDSTLTATQGKMRIIGNVKGTANWNYQLARKVEAGLLPSWTYYKLTAGDAIEAGVLKQEVLDEKRTRLPEGIFLELYYAIPFVNSSNKFCFAFEKPKHVRPCQWNPEQFTYLSFDFNRNPICCSIIQWYDGRIRVPQVIKLPNSNIYKLLDHIKNKYPGAYFIVSGDSTGRNKSALTEDDVNYYDIIKMKLGLSENQMQQINNPKLVDNQVLVNAVLEHVPVDMDPDGAQALIFDCEFVEMLPDGTIKKGDRNDPTQQADALDTFRYWINRYMDGFVRMVEAEDLRPQG